LKFRVFISVLTLLLGLSNLPAQAQSASPLGLLDLVNLAEEIDQSSYDRSFFKHWIDQDRNGCDTREEVLKAESKEKAKTGKGCEILSGKWLSLYESKTFTKASQLDIDHMVPLKEAWESGADSWSSQERELFANDLGFKDSLIAVSASTNRSKGDRDPSEWKPSNKAFACQYAVAWVSVKYRWSLNVDQAEYSSLKSMLGNCAKSQIFQLPNKVSLTSQPEPTESPLPSPSPSPSEASTNAPITSPSASPSATPAPSPSATLTPTPSPTPTPSNSNLPTISPGAFCSASAAGTQGVGSNGQIYTCKTSQTDSRHRWRI
jgi:hypothetical protein